MIKHIVMWNVQGGTASEKADGAGLLKRSFESLRGRVPGLLYLEVGIDASRVDYACDVVLYSEFESRAALDAYAAHPEHLRVKRELGGLRTARHQVDYEAEPGGMPGSAGQQSRKANHLWCLFTRRAKRKR